ncbi:MAG: hypothetical protein K8R90_03630 [Candidatus Cloacimonetes bacterium]|nr:hypothetical protein [Candidatus Cloacimonadota bacterium]
MKRLACIVVLLLFMVTACGTINKLSRDGVDEQEFVSRFLTLMINNNENDAEMFVFLAPEYLQSNAIEVDAYQVNSYSPVGFSIEEYDPSTGLITTHIWGEDNSWVHELVFKLVKNEGRLYLMPGRHSDVFVDPWFEVRSYIEN